MTQTAIVGAEIRRTLLMADDHQDGIDCLIDLLKLFREHPELRLTLKLEVEDLPAEVLEEISGFSVRGITRNLRDRKSARIHHDRQTGKIVEAVFWGKSKI